VTTGVDLVNAAARFGGEPYNIAAGRDSPTSGHKDCSGLIVAAYRVATGSDLRANVSSTIFALCARQGLEITLEEARATAGACLLLPDDPLLGEGSKGHIGFSDGEGGTVEATPPRVQRLDISFQRWGPRACKLPDIDYEEDAMPKGFLAKTPDQPFVWFITPVGVRVATKSLEHQKLLQFFGHSSNGPNNVAELSTAQVEAFPIWEPEKK
jgi:hypothetical protein